MSKIESGKERRLRGKYWSLYRESDFEQGQVLRHVDGNEVPVGKWRNWSLQDSGNFSKGGLAARNFAVQR